jgi:hypothetical protein
MPLAKQPARPADTDIDAPANTAIVPVKRDDQWVSPDKGQEPTTTHPVRRKTRSAPQARKTTDNPPVRDAEPVFGSTIVRTTSHDRSRQDGGGIGGRSAQPASRTSTHPVPPEDDAAKTLVENNALPIPVETNISRSGCVEPKSKAHFVPGSKLDLTLRASRKSALAAINNGRFHDGHCYDFNHLSMSLVTNIADMADLEVHERVPLIEAAFSKIHEVLENNKNGIGRAFGDSKDNEYKMMEAIEKIARNDVKSLLVLQSLAKMQVFNEGQDWQTLVDQCPAKLPPDSAPGRSEFVEAIDYVLDNLLKEPAGTKAEILLSEDQGDPGAEQDDLSEVGVFKTYFGNSLRALLRKIGEPKKNWAYIIVGPYVTDPAIMRDLVETAYDSDDLLPWRDLIRTSLDIHINPCEISDTDEKPYHLIIDNYKNNIKEDRISFFFEFAHQRFSFQGCIEEEQNFEFSESFLRNGRNLDKDLHTEWFLGICPKISVRHPAALRVSYGDDDLKSWFQERMGKSNADEDDVCGAIMLPFVSISSRALRYNAGILTGDDLAHVIKLIDYNKTIVKRHEKNTKRIDRIKKEKKADAENREKKENKRDKALADREKSRISPGGPDLASMPGFTPQLKRRLRRMVRRFKLPSEKPPGLILHGPTGSGKTFIAKRMAFESGRAMIEASISGWETGHGYEQVLEAMAECFKKAREQAPSVVFIDEIDGFTVRDPTARGGGGYNAGIVNCFLELMDGQKPRGDIVVIGATNLLDAVDPAVRRHGRLGFEIEIGLPELPQVAELVAFYFPHLDAAAVDALAIRIGAGCPPPVFKALADEAAGCAADEKEELF